MLREVQPDIRRYARRQCYRTSAIEDVVQEVLIVLYRRLGNVRDPLALAGWIFRVVTRLCLLPVLALLRGAEELTERHEDITREACKSRIHRGRALLREYLQGDESRGGRK